MGGAEVGGLGRQGRLGQQGGFGALSTGMLRGQHGRGLGLLTQIQVHPRVQENMKVLKATYIAIRAAIRARHLALAVPETFTC